MADHGLYLAYALTTRPVGSKLLILPWTSAAQAGGANTATNAMANRPTRCSSFSSDVSSGVPRHDDGFLQPGSRGTGTNSYVIVLAFRPSLA